MSLHRIFCDQRLQSGAAVTLAGDAASHVLRVLRLRTGDHLVMFDGSGTDFDGEITGLGRDQVGVRVNAGRAVANESPLSVTLLQGVCRGPRMDTVIQKATELGVAAIEPVLTDRGLVRLSGDPARRKQEHWRRVAIAAAEQSGRSRIPRIGEPRPLEESLPETAAMATRIVLDPQGSRLSALASPRSPLGLLIGPEGGLTDSEKSIAADCGFSAVSLGPRILRTETAPLAALALLQFLGGDLA